MKIAVDLDGVVFNSEMYFMAAAEIYDAGVLGKNSLVKPEEPRVQKKYRWSEEELQGYISRFSISTQFDIMPCAKTVIDAMKAGNELYVISARGQFDPAEIEIAQQKLREGGICFDRYFFGHLDKTETVLSNGIDVMIDDRYDVCEELSQRGVFCLYFRMAGRKSVPETENLKTVNNWGEIYRILKNKNIIRGDCL